MVSHALQDTLLYTEPSMDHTLLESQIKENHNGESSQSQGIHGADSLKRVYQQIGRKNWNPKKFTLRYVANVMRSPIAAQDVDCSPGSHERHRLSPLAGQCLACAPNLAIGEGFTPTPQSCKLGQMQQQVQEQVHC